MTFTDRTLTDSPIQSARIAPLRFVAVDLYKDIHKGIRSELFAVTEEAGNLDLTQRHERMAIAGHLRRVVDLLVSHAAHEDAQIQPAIETHLPALAAEVLTDHEDLEGRIHGLATESLAAVDSGDTAENLRWAGQRLHVELASFTSAYLAHQDLEERLIMPALEDAIGFEAVLDIHEAIVSSIPPDEMAVSLAVMMPAMNIDDRAELLGGMRDGAPPEVFDRVWSLVGSVLAPDDVAALSSRLAI